MAATEMTPVQLELITSLSQEDIPIKLRCAICSKLAVNAFRLPCCEQAICENCQSALPKACPVCEHTPVTPHDCTPHKSLRTTIKVFLRTEEKKRGALLAKAAKDTPPETPVEAAPPQIPEATQEPSTDDIAQPPNEDQPPGHSEVNKMNGEDNDHIKEEPTTDNAMAIIPAHTYSDHDMDIPHESIEEIAPGQEHDEEKSNVDDASTTNGEGVDGVPAFAGGMMGGAGGGVGMAGMGMNPMMGMMAGMGGDMSGMNQMQQMQMMMAMQGGMGGFPMMSMMGMPGLSMDPMAMQNIYGMGMGMGANNKSNMGMGMSNANMGANGMIGGNMGQGGGGYERAQGGWNGQQAWNTSAGGDNFNANNAAGSSTNLHDFASSGYPNRGGFVRGGYQSHQEFGYGRGRGRGRGRGGFGGGRGGGMWNQAAEFQQSGWNANMASGAEEQDVRKTTERNPNVDEFGREIRAVTPDEDAKTGGDDIAPKEEGTEGPNTDGQAGIEQHNNQEQWNENHPNGNGEYNDQGYDASYDQNYGHGYDTYNQQQGYGYNNVAPSQPPVDVPINAPTGPKAMREGFPNIGLVHLKGHKSRQGSASFSRPYSSGSGANNIEVADRTKRDDRREGDRDKYAEDREREAERRERRERRHREGQDERSEDEKESERRRERRRRRREEAEAAEGSTKDEARDGNAAEQDRARSASPTESKHESHRLSRRDKDRSDRHSDRDSHRHRDRSRHRDRDDKDRSDRDRDRDRERSDRDKEREKDKSSRSDRSDRDRSDKHRSSRSHRDRSRSRDRSERDKDEKSSRSSRRDRERDSERHSDNRSSRRHRDEERENDTAPVLKPPTGPKSMSIFDSKGPSGGIRPTGGIQIKGASSRPLRNTHANSASNSKSNSSSSKPKEVDPHTAEREARNRERLLKEAQRMAGLAGLVGVVPSGPRKREREEERGGGRRKRRGKSGGGFDGADETGDGDAGEDEEERIRRNEMEREGARGR